MTAMEKYTFNLLLAILFLLFSRMMEYFAVLGNMRVLLLATLLCVLAFAFSGFANRIFSKNTTNGEAYCIAILTTWIMFLLPFSIWVGGSVHTFYAYYLNGAIVFLLIISMVNSLERLKKVINITVIAFTIVIIEAAYRKLFNFNAGFDYGRLGGLGNTFKSSNLLGFMIVLTFPFYFYSLFIVQKRFIRIVLLGIMGLAIFDLCATMSRGGFLGFIVIAIIIIKDMVQSRKVGIAILLIIVGIAGSFFLPDTFVERISTIFVKTKDYVEVGYSSTRQATASSEARSCLVDRAVESIKENPMFGVGIGCYGVASVRKYGKGFGQVTHVTYLDYATELGLPGLLIYLILLYYALTGIQKTIKQIRGYSVNRRISEIRFISLALRSSIFAFSVMSLFISIGYEFYIFFLIGMVVAVRRIIVKEITDKQQKPCNVTNIAVNTRKIRGAI